MLSILVNKIETNLISYIKQVEPDAEHHLEDGIEVLVRHAKQLPEHRKKDIIAIHRFCEMALENNDKVYQLVEQVFQYVKNMQSGFLGFSGKSRLRALVFLAIDQYDLRYLQYHDGNILLNPQGKFFETDTNPEITLQTQEKPVAKQIKELVAENRSLRTQVDTLTQSAQEMRQEMEALKTASEETARHQSQKINALQSANCQLMQELSEIKMLLKAMLPQLALNEPQAAPVPEEKNATNDSTHASTAPASRLSK